MREDDVPLAAAEAQQRVAMVLEKADEPPEGLDPLPLVPGRDPGVEDAPGLGGSRPIRVRLLQDATNAQHGPAGVLALGSSDLLELLHPSHDLYLEGLYGLESWRRREHQLCALGHRATLGEVMAGPLDDLAGPTNAAWVGPDTWPIPAVLDESGGGGIGKRVGDLLNDIVRGDQGDGAVAERCPEVLYPAVERVEGFGDDPVEEVAEIGEVGARVGDDQVETQDPSHLSSIVQV